MLVELSLVRVVLEEPEEPVEQQVHLDQLQTVPQQQVELGVLVELVVHFRLEGLSEEIIQLQLILQIHMLLQV